MPALTAGTSDIPAHYRTLADTRSLVGRKFNQMLALIGMLALYSPRTLLAEHPTWSAKAPLEQAPAVVRLDRKAVGLYGVTPWKAEGKNPAKDSYYERVGAMDFNIRTLTYNETITSDRVKGWVVDVNRSLVAAQTFTPAKAMILRIDFWNSGRERYEHDVKLQPIEFYQARLNEVIDQVDWKNPSLVGVCLSEENVPGNNKHAEYLTKLYEGTKARYPGLKVWQWFSPNLTVPGKYGAYEIPADGWIIDPYTLCKEWYPDEKFHLTNDPYTFILNKYLATSKPVVCVIYASTDRKQYWDPADPLNRFKIDMWEIVEHQFSVNQAKNVPTCFYWEWHDPVKKRNDVLFDLTVDDPLMRRINEKVAEFIRRAHS